MAQDIGYDFATGPTVTLLSSDLSDGSQSSFTSTVDFGAAPTPIAFGFELILTGQASASDICYLELVWSHDNSDFSDANNTEKVVACICTASGDAKVVGSYPVKARYAQFRLNNQSGGTIDGTSSNTALILTDISLDQA